MLGLPGGAGRGGTTKGVKSKSLGFLDVSEGVPRVSRARVSRSTDARQALGKSTVY